MKNLEMLRNLIENIEKEMNYCKLNFEAPMICSHNTIVATEDAKYQVSCDKDGHAIILIGDLSNPVWFSPKEGDRVVANVKASNGYGELKFHAYGFKTFFRKRYDNLADVRESILSLMK